MKLFFDFKFDKCKTLFLLPFLILFQACATYHPQFGHKIKNPVEDTIADTSQIAHTFYLIGDAGNADLEKANEFLILFHQELIKSDKNSTLLFLGDNIYPLGVPPEEDKINYEIAHNKLIKQLELSKDFKGKTIFIPGNHDWYSGLEGLKRQEKIVTDYLNDKKSFLPKKGCAIDDVKINDQILLITIDSQWFLENWDKTPKINDNCSIKTREAFIDELESILKKNWYKTVIIAFHHPLFTHGSHGGHYSFKKHIFPFKQPIPLPVIGSFLNLLRKTTGASPQDYNNKVYSNFTKRIETIIRPYNNIIVVSGHDHSLQYLDSKNIKQIISGSGSNISPAKAIDPKDFTYGKLGYATLEVYKNGKTVVSFYGKENNEIKLIHNRTVFPPKKKTEITNQNNFSPTRKASIYTPKIINKSGLYNYTLGTHYRKYYGTLIESKVATFDTLFGGLKPKRPGGGHQTKTLRLKSSDDKEYIMRGLKKSPNLFLQKVIFKKQYIGNVFEDSAAEDLIYDIFTTAHPYASMAIGDLADKVKILHPNQFLFFIPKHPALGTFNTDFGNELYFIEERPSESYKCEAIFCEPEAIIGTEKLLEKLHKDEKYTVDENEYIKARLFDMLVGDWDRHYDQWRWAEHKEGNKIVYKPIARDRDQVFYKYNGKLFSLIMKIPPLRHMQNFDKDIKNVKWFNREAYPLDLAILKTSTEKDWITQAKFIQENLSDEAINHAFDNLPKEVQDETIAEIKKNLKLRRAQLTKYAHIYNRVLQKTAVIVGTNKKDKFIINPISKKHIEIEVYRLKKDGEELIYNKSFHKYETKNIWIYGLDNNDTFEVKGTEKSCINIRLIGGHNNDIYNITNGKKVKITDFKSKKNTFNIDNKTRKLLTDDYNINFYDYTRPRYNSLMNLPNFGYNPDDGVKMGIVSHYKVYHFKQNPYTTKHSFKANYFFATNGFEFMYDLYNPIAIGKWDFDLKTQITSPNFSINFFGYGNNSIDQQEPFGMDYNRVRVRILRAVPQIKKVGPFGSTLSFQTSFERYDIEKTENRFIATPNIADPRIFSGQQFAGASVKYSFKNHDNESFPTMGMEFSIEGTWKMNIEDSKRNFPYLESQFSFSHQLDKKGNVVFASLLKGKRIFNNNFEFYQGATLGGDYDLRGFRDERFIGNSSFFQSSDIRFTTGRIKKSLIPMYYGIFGGFDYGRVWLDKEESDTWHHSIGGGLWLNALKAYTVRLTYFKSPKEESRITFGLGFGF